MDALDGHDIVELRSAWKELSRSIRWTIFATLTFPMCVSLDSAQKAFYWWLRRIQKKVIFCKISWMMVIEAQKRGAPHLHVLLAGPDPVLCAQIAAYWPHRHPRAAMVVPFIDDLHQRAVSYVLKGLEQGAEPMVGGPGFPSRTRKQPMLLRQSLMRQRGMKEFAFSLGQEDRLLVEAAVHLFASKSQESWKRSTSASMTSPGSIDVRRKLALGGWSTSVHDHPLRDPFLECLCSQFLTRSNDARERWSRHQSLIGRVTFTDESRLELPKEQPVAHWMLPKRWMKKRGQTRIRFLLPLQRGDDRPAETAERAFMEARRSYGSGRHHPKRLLAWMALDFMIAHVDQQEDTLCGEPFEKFLLYHFVRLLNDERNCTRNREQARSKRRLKEEAMEKERLRHAQMELGSGWGRESRSAREMRTMWRHGPELPVVPADDSAKADPPPLPGLEERSKQV